MIFKKSKVLIDNILDPVSGKSLRGHKVNPQVIDFQCLRIFLAIRPTLIPIPLKTYMR